MLPLTKSVFSVIETMLPPTLFSEPLEEKAVLNIAMRIEMTNNMLSTFLAYSDIEPSMLNDIDTDELAQKLVELKTLIEDTKPFFNQESKPFSQLERMCETIAKIEKKLPLKLGAFNFDLERMKERVNDSFFELPQLDSVEELDKWLMAK